MVMVREKGDRHRDVAFSGGCQRGSARSQSPFSLPLSLWPMKEGQTRVGRCKLRKLFRKLCYAEGNYEFVSARCGAGSGEKLVAEVLCLFEQLDRRTVGRG